MNRLVFLLVFLSLFFVLPAGATTIISPLVEIEADPGQTQTGVVKIFNETDQDLFLTASIEDFSPVVEAGQAVYQGTDPKSEQLEWFELAQDEIVLLPRQVIIVPFTITVPQTATPGGYYAAILWQSETKAVVDQPNVGVNSKVGTLVLLKVNGEVLEAGEIVDFQTQPVANYFFELPINFTVRFVNSGNIHLRPTGQVELAGPFGQSIDLPINLNHRNVLPASSRRFEVVWGQSKAGNFLVDFWQGLKSEITNFAIGPYSASASLTYGTANQQVVSLPITFWLVPYRLLIVFVLGLIILFWLFRTNRKMNKLKNSARKKK